MNDGDDTLFPSHQVFGDNKAPDNHGKNQGSNQTQEGEDVGPFGISSFGSQGLPDRGQGGFANVLIFKGGQPFSRLGPLIDRESHLFQVPLMMPDDVVELNQEICDKVMLLETQLARWRDIDLVDAKQNEYLGAGGVEAVDITGK